MSKYTSAVLFNGIIYCFPDAAGSVCMTGTGTDTFSMVLAVKGAWGNENSVPIISAVVSSATIYLLRMGQVIIFNPSTKTITETFSVAQNLQ